MAVTVTQNPRPITQAIIIDDDQGSVDVLAEALGNHPEIKLAGSAPSARSGLKLLKEQRPEIVFLDIEFDEDSGLDLLTELREDPDRSLTPKVVFYTSYKKYLIQAIRFKAFDFILKPFSKHELDLVLKRYFAEATLPDTLPAPLPLPECGSKKTLSITTITNDKVIVATSDIIYFKYDSTYKLWEVVLTSLKHFILKRHTTADVILSSSPKFVRTHKSYILNLDYLACISGNDCQLLPPFDSITEIKISRGYRKGLLDRFYDL